MRSFNCLLLLFIFPIGLFAGTIKGHVYSRQTREQLVGATIVLMPGSRKTITSLDGGYIIGNLATATYAVKVSYTGYTTIDTTFTVPSTANTVIDFYLDPHRTILSSVIVAAAANGGTDEYGSRSEKNASNIVNIVSAQTIALSPDITVANVMQRISGVSIERSNSGDGQYAIIRGMDKRYNTTLINGVKIPSPDNRNRYVPMDIFPAELLDRLEIIKSLTPDMEGDAAGGVINLVTKNAASHFKVEGNVGTGYGQFYLSRNFNQYQYTGIAKKSPAEILGPGAYAPVSAFPYSNLVLRAAKPPVNQIASVTVSNRFLHQKLGVIFSGSYQHTYRGTDSKTLVQNTTLGVAPDVHSPLIQTFSDIYIRQYSTEVSRLGAEAKADYVFNANHSISLFATYLQLNERRSRVTSDSLLGGYSDNGYVGSFAVYQRDQTRSDLQDIYNLTLQGKNDFGARLRADWSLVTSAARRQLPDIAEFSTAQAITPNTTTGTITVADPVVQHQSRQWIRNTDKDLAGYLNFHYGNKVDRHQALIGWGGLYRHKQRDNYDNKYSLSPVTDSGSNYQQFVSIPAAKFTFIPSTDALGNAAGNAGIYTFKEDIAAGYADIKYAPVQALELLGGIRVEHTLQHFESSLPVSVDGKSGTITYNDLLPSIQAKYALDNKKAIRFSYFRSIFRPAYADLIPFVDNSSNENYATSGNPHLQHTVIDNADLRYEMFPKGLDQYMIGAFYKFIKDPIEYSLAQVGYSSEQILGPNNFGNANNFGIELVFRKFFGKFGVSGNYTFTNSVIRSIKRYQYYDDNNNTIQDSVRQQRPLQGQSAHIGNLSLLFKDVQHKWDVQLALVYTGERINTLSVYKNLDNWEKASTTLDFSAQKQFGRHYIVYMKANNLLNTPFHLFIKQHNYGYSPPTKLPFQRSPNYATVQYDQYYATYLLGFKFKF